MITQLSFEIKHGRKVSITSYLPLSVGVYSMKQRSLPDEVFLIAKDGKPN
jgi:hypothetical protein